MKFIITSVVFLIFTYFSFVSCKSLKGYYGNKVSTFKGQRIPLASPVANGIHDNYTRSKRETPKAITDFQALLIKAKSECADQMNMQPTVMSKSLLEEQHLTDDEKCLILCIMKKTQLIDNNNKLSINNIVALAHSASGGNDLVKAIAKATAEKCNSAVTAKNKCDAAGQISKCLSQEIKTYKMKLAF